MYYVKRECLELGMSAKEGYARGFKILRYRKDIVLRCLPRSHAGPLSWLCSGCPFGSQKRRICSDCLILSHAARKSCNYKGRKVCVEFSLPIAPQSGLDPNRPCAPAWVPIGSPRTCQGAWSRSWGLCCSQHGSGLVRVSCGPGGARPPGRVVSYLYTPLSIFLEKAFFDSGAVF